MNEKKTKISLLDYAVLLVRYKKFIFGITLLIMVSFYLSVYFFVDEQFDSTATIIPAQDNSLSGLAGALGGFADLPFDMGGFQSNPEIGLYNTILKSRTNAERIIEKYDLWQVYELDKSEPKEVKEARETFLGNLGSKENDDGAFIISLRTPDPELSAEITNDIVWYLNDKIIELKIAKSKENKEFLGKRLEDVRERLRESEDSLKDFQKKSGLLSPEEQFKGIITAYAGLEQDLITKQIERDILQEVLPKDSPQLRNINLEIKYFQEKFQEIKTEGKENSIFIPYNELPSNAIEYYRYYREVEINNRILEFVLPLYEQAKVEEQKKIPVLQVIDYAKPAEEKSFPPRLILTLIVGLGVFSILFAFILLKENKELKSNNNLRYIKDNIFKWNSRSR